MPLLRLSPHVLPQIRQGLHHLVPQNLAPGDDRIHYGQAVVQTAQTLVARGQIDEVRRFREETMFGPRLFTLKEDAEGKVSVEPLPELENALGLRPEELGVLLRDGRIRDDSAMAYLPTGESTPALGDLLMRLHHGIERAELLERAAAHDIGFDEELLADLLARGIIEEGGVAVPPRPTQTGITWMGHAYVRASCNGFSAWFDPFPAPRVRWTDEECRSMFKDDVPDMFLLEGYGPDAHHVTQDEVPIPDAVFITHQDTDHMDLGALALLPPGVPIYVPAAEPGKPWQIDLVAAIRTVLGVDRDVRVLRHGETATIGEIRVTAFPFIGEFPVALPHTWNCYLLELPDQVWALCADSGVTDMHVDWLRERLAGNTPPFGIMVNGIVKRSSTTGYRDILHEAVSFARLFSWYLPPASTFEKTPTCGLPLEILQRLVREVGLSQVYPYAHGNLPWYRLTGTYLHHSHVGSHSLATFQQMEQLAASVSARVLRLRHGQLHAANPSSPLPRRART